ncbi:MAG: hypothetical protein RLZZ337_696 [Bacteroidota bacterium]|jgi:cytochrome c oxidase assembly protein subunit 15
MLFFLGGLVRSTGSGMGCPDWPKCFGEYIPPTSADALPQDYESYFQKQRIEKTVRFAKVLTFAGFKQKAKQLLDEPQIQETHEFNVVKAYVEYINRLWGALSGLVVFVTLALSFTYLKQKPAVFIYTLLGYIAVFVNALLGAVVVNTNLVSGLVTAHFLAAFAAISFFIIARFKLKEDGLSTRPTNSMIIVSLGTLLLIILQTIAGTQVREVYESSRLSGQLNFEQANALGTSFVIHRILAVLSIIVAGYQWLILKKAKGEYNSIERMSFWLVVIIIAQIVFGSVLVLTNFQSFSKLFHITLAAGVFVLQFYICASLLKYKKSIA